MSSPIDTKSSWPIPLEELLQRRDACAKAAVPWGILQAVIFLTGLAVPILLVSWLRNAPPEYQWLNAAGLVLFFAFLFGNLLLTNFTLRRRQLAFHLICPSCAALLNGRIMQVAMVTGHCSQCGMLLVSDHPSHPPHAKPVTDAARSSGN